MARRLISVITALAIGAAACSSTHKVPMTQSSAGRFMWQVKAGDTIRVTLRDGASAEFKVQSVTPDSIVSSDGSKYEHADITLVERREISGAKTAAATVGGTLVVVYVVAALAVTALLGKLFGGGS